MIGPDFTTAEANFVIRAVEGYVFDDRPLRVTPAIDVHVLMAKLAEMKKQASAMHAARTAYLAALHAEDASDAPSNRPLQFEL